MGLLVINIEIRSLELVLAIFRQTEFCQIDFYNLNKSQTFLFSHCNTSFAFYLHIILYFNANRNCISKQGW